jgi:hypothetical protein
MVPTVEGEPGFFKLKGEHIMAQYDKRVPWILWPFYALWQLVGLLFKLTGRLIAAVLGLVLVTVGIIISLTIIGAIIGIPLVLLGLMLMVRAIF